MVIDGVKKRFEGLRDLGFYPNPSSFVLCECIKNKDKYELKTIIPLENNMNNVVIDRDNLILTDTQGEVLTKFDSSSFKKIAIEYVNDNDILLSNYEIIRPNFVPKRLYENIRHYHYDKTFNLENILYDNKDGKLEKFANINNDSFLIKKNKNFEKSSSIYSIKQKRFVTPSFPVLEPVENTSYTIFKFEDKVYSSLEINNIRFSSKIIGFITVDGKFYNGVYDELSNKEIECELNSKKYFKSDFVEYNELKEMIQGKLNEKVVKESNKQITKDFIIKKLENKAKKIYNNK